MSLRSQFSGMIRGAMRNNGREVVRYDEVHFFELQEKRLFRDHKINLVLDIGANSGQTGEELRAHGYQGKIISFEPLSAPFKQLQEKAKNDAGWRCINAGMGAAVTKQKINVSGTDCSSSFLEMDPRHVSMVSTSGYVGVEEVQVETVDHMAPTIIEPNDRVFMKIDTQGYEMFVLQGALATLPRIDLVKIEVSTASLYEGQGKPYKVMEFMDNAGFDMIGVLPHFYEASTGRFLQFDLLFGRRATADSKVPSPKS